MGALIAANISAAGAIGIGGSDTSPGAQNTERLNPINQALSKVNLGSIRLSVPEPSARRAMFITAGTDSAVRFPELQASMRKNSAGEYEATDPKDRFTEGLLKATQRYLIETYGSAEKLNGADGNRNNPDQVVSVTLAVPDTAAAAASHERLAHGLPESTAPVPGFKDRESASESGYQVVPDSERKEFSVLSTRATRLMVGGAAVARNQGSVAAADEAGPAINILDEFRALAPKAVVTTGADHAIGNKVAAAINEFIAAKPEIALQLGALNARHVEDTPTGRQAIIKAVLAGAGIGVTAGVSMPMLLKAIPAMREALVKMGLPEMVVDIAIMPCIEAAVSTIAEEVDANGLQAIIEQAFPSLQDAFSNTISAVSSGLAALPKYLLSAVADQFPGPVRTAVSLTLPTATIPQGNYAARPLPMLGLECRDQMAASIIQDPLMTPLSESDAMAHATVALKGSKIYGPAVQSIPVIAGPKGQNDSWLASIGKAHLSLPALGGAVDAAISLGAPEQSRDTASRISNAVQLIPMQAAEAINVGAYTIGNYFQSTDRTHKTAGNILHAYAENRMPTLQEVDTHPAGSSADWGTNLLNSTFYRRAMLLSTNAENLPDAEA